MATRNLRPHSTLARRTVVVEGALAFRMRRIAAAQTGERGLQIMTLPQLAARLAGGYARPARAPDLDRAIRSALARGDLNRMDAIKDLPGCARAVARTLNRIWRADFQLDGHDAPHMKDLHLLEERVRQSLPVGILTPRDLRDAALARIVHAKATLGPVILEGCTEVAPLWRPLIAALAREVEVVWETTDAAAIAWYSGKVVARSVAEAATPAFLACADPRAEVVEALRWMRELMASDKARPDEIAICAAATETWDLHFLALAREAGLPLHFSHGTPALVTRDGQACAALADLLLNGLSQERVVRLLGYSRGEARALKSVPHPRDLQLRGDAALFEFAQWQRALERASDGRKDGFDYRKELLPALALLAEGADSAERAGAQLLGPSARNLWQEALRRGPAKAIFFSLEELRVPDDRDPGSAPVWGPADHLRGSPRPFVRLLGLNTRCWPRSDSENPLLPSHILAPSAFGIPTAKARDEATFRHILRHASKSCVISHALRDARGSLLAPSPLLPRDPKPEALKRTRVPAHAYSEADRLLARPKEATMLPFAVSASSAWNDWQKGAATPHDGLVRPAHPAILRSLDEVQSATRLRQLLRNPLGYVWRYALGWRSPPQELQPLDRDDRSFGELVHVLLKRSVDRLEPQPGLGRAGEVEIENALAAAVHEIREEWPLERPVPPLMLWDHTLEAARDLAFKALTFDDPFSDAASQSWTELPFGLEEGAPAAGGAPSPWPSTTEVRIPVANMRVQGRIDRLDLSGAGAVRLTDYKTGREPKNAAAIVLDRGRELQRVTYALAAAQLLPDVRRLQARLIFLGSEGPKAHALTNVDQAMQELGQHVAAARNRLEQGMALPGPDAREAWNDFKLALPAANDGYFRRKARAFGDALRPVDDVWQAR